MDAISSVGIDTDGSPSMSFKAWFFLEEWSDEGTIFVWKKNSTLFGWFVEMSTISMEDLTRVVGLCIGKCREISKGSV